MKRKTNLGRSSNKTKRQRLLRLSQNNNGSPDNCNILAVPPGVKDEMRNTSAMEPSKKTKLSKNLVKLWKLNICVLCTKSLDTASKLLKCLHGLCQHCIELHINDPGLFKCVCQEETDISNKLISFTLFCEQFDEGILRNNYMDDEHQTQMYGQYTTKAPCTNCDDQKYIEVYCITCNKLHCALCHLRSHRLHEFKTICKVMEEIRSNLMKNKVDLCNKLSFLDQAKSLVESDLVTLKLHKRTTRIEYKKKFKEIHAELKNIENQIWSYLDGYYKEKNKHLSSNIMLMELLKKKYDFYLNFAESVLKKENKADLDISNLVNNYMLNVRKSFVVDIGVFRSPDTNIEFKMKLESIMSQLIDSVKDIVVCAPTQYINKINAFCDTSMEISYFEGYQSVVKKIEDNPGSIINEEQVDQIIKYNIFKQQKKSLKSPLVSSQTNKDDPKFSKPRNALQDKRRKRKRNE